MPAIMVENPSKEIYTEKSFSEKLLEKRE